MKNQINEFLYTWTVINSIKTLLNLLPVTQIDNISITDFILISVIILDLYLLSGVKKTAEKVLGTTAQVVGILAGGKISIRGFF